MDLNSATHATVNWFWWTVYPKAALHTTGGNRCLRCDEPWPCPSVRVWTA